MKKSEKADLRELGGDFYLENYIGMGVLPCYNYLQKIKKESAELKTIQEDWSHGTRLQIS